MASPAMSTAHELSSSRSPVHPGVVAPAPHAARPAPGDTELRAEARASREYAVQTLARLQNASGSWPGDYGGPMFLLPMYLGLCHATNRLPSREQTEKRKTKFFHVQP